MNDELRYERARLRWERANGQDWRKTGVNLKYTAADNLPVAYNKRSGRKFNQLWSAEVCMNPKILFLDDYRNWLAGRPSGGQNLTLQLSRDTAMNLIWC